MGCRKVEEPGMPQASRYFLGASPATQRVAWASRRKRPASRRSDVTFCERTATTGQHVCRLNVRRASSQGRQKGSRSSVPDLPRPYFKRVSRYQAPYRLNVRGASTPDRHKRRPVS